MFATLVVKLFQVKAASIKKWEFTTNFLFYPESWPVRCKVQGQISFQSLHCPHTHSLSLRQTLSQWLRFCSELFWNPKKRRETGCHFLKLRFSFVVCPLFTSVLMEITSTVTRFTKKQKSNKNSKQHVTVPALCCSSEQLLWEAESRVAEGAARARHPRIPRCGRCGGTAAPGVTEAGCAADGHVQTTAAAHEGTV